MKMTTTKSSKNRGRELHRQNRHHRPHLTMTMKYCLLNATKITMLVAEVGGTEVVAEAIRVDSLPLLLQSCSRRTPKRGKLMRLAQLLVGVHSLLLIIFKRIHNYTNKMTSGLRSMPLKLSIKWSYKTKRLRSFRRLCRIPRQNFFWLLVRQVAEKTLLWICIASKTIFR